VKPVRPTEPQMKTYMKIRVDDDKPFRCLPRRLSYAEKAEVQRILDEYMALGYIRPSDSEYVSPIVLVK